MKETHTKSKSKVKFQNILNMDRCATNDKTLSKYDKTLPDNAFSDMDFQIVLR